MTRIRPMGAALLLLVSACAHFTRSPPRVESSELQYTVRAELPILHVHVRRMSGPVRAFLFSMPGQVTFVKTEASVLAVTSEGFTLPENWTSFEYRYDIDRAIADRGQDLYSGAGRGTSRLVAGRAYLARPRTVHEGDRATLHIDGAQLPWAPDADGSYSVTGQDLIDSGFHVFGGKSLRRDSLSIALLEGKTRASAETLQDWIDQAASEFLTVRTSLPFQHISVALLPVPNATEPALFGMALYSTPRSVALLVGGDASEKSFRTDWVAVHELLHLAHPVFQPQAPWLSEGLATYYTELARMRSGRFTEEAGWAELRAGFERGQEQAGQDTMEEVTRSTHRYLALYWSGALFALDADVHLREATKGAHSLDDLLHSGMSSLKEFGEAADKLAGAPFFFGMLSQHWNSRAFTALPRLLKILGAETTPLRHSPLRSALIRKNTVRLNGGSP
ncbi:MAG: hypothetical protein ACT4TC_10305 [Myxococcaceae bacterium]